ncbi:MAG: DsbC family protein [Pseudomonadota bacterium]
MLRPLLLLFMLCCCAGASAESTARTAKGLDPGGWALRSDTAEIKTMLLKNYPQIGLIKQVNKAPFLGLYEIVTEDQVLYTDEKAQYLISGSVYSLKTMSNLTEERSRKLFAIDFNSLPFDLAIKIVKGNGKRKMAYFTDPNCDYCQKLESELKNVTNLTLYLYLYPIFPGSDIKVRNIECSKNPAKSWEDLMLRNVQPVTATCKTPTEKIMALGDKFHINGTPTLIFADGSKVPGYMPLAELEKSLNSSR